MASLTYDPATKNAFIQWRDGERARRGIRLASVSKSFAERFHSLVETLADARRIGVGVDRYTTDFLNELPDCFFDTLVKTELVEPRTSQPDDVEVIADEPQGLTLGEFLTGYLARRTDLKKTSLIVFGNAVRNLVKHFGQSREHRQQ